MKFVKEIIIKNAGVKSSNGIYKRDEGGKTKFECDSKSHIEWTVDGWILWDYKEDEQTYLFSYDFKECIPIGDAIFPAPSFDLIYSND